MDTILEKSNGVLSGGRLLNAVEVAKLLNISLPYAYRLMQTGQIPIVRLGRAKRVRPQDLDAYINRNIFSADDLDLID